MIVTCSSKIMAPDQFVALFFLWYVWRLYSTDKRSVWEQRLVHRRRRRRTIVALVVYNAWRRHCSSIPRIRSVWCKPRSRDWWMAVRSGVVGEEWWKENLRMTKGTFLFLCDNLRPYITKKVTRFRQPVSVEERVAVTVWKLATNIEYRTLSDLFGLGRSTIGRIVIETCKAISTHLFSEYVYIPRGEKLREIVNGFESDWGFPQAVGAIDGSHIPIVRPIECASDYYNRKNYYSVIMQGLVDHLGLFMDVCIGWPGKVHDARVFTNSLLYQKGTNSSLFPDWKRTISGVDVPLVILGDSAYPALKWLVKPFPETPTITDDQRLYNYRQSRARMIVENSFGRLKGRWRCLLKRLDVKLDNVSHVVAACVVLHNICELKKDDFLEEWLQSQPTGSANPTHSSSSRASTNTASANDIRDAFVQHFASQ